MRRKGCYVRATPARLVLRANWTIGATLVKQPATAARLVIITSGAASRTGAGRGVFVIPPPPRNLLQRPVQNARSGPPVSATVRRASSPTLAGMALWPVRRSTRLWRMSAVYSGWPWMPSACSPTANASTRVFSEKASTVAPGGSSHTSSWWTSTREALEGSSLRSPRNAKPFRSRAKVTFFTPTSHPFRALPTLPPSARHRTWWPKQTPRTRFSMAWSARMSSQRRRTQGSSPYASCGLPLTTKPSYDARSSGAGNSPAITRKQSHLSAPSSPASPPPNAATKTLRYPPYTFLAYSESHSASSSAYRLPTAAGFVAATAIVVCRVQTEHRSYAQRRGSSRPATRSASSS
ncbi:hypothetical protein PAHAL_1G060600 [Panicum hallii]|uniref:Uncharacterized protein n=1 Tax=Panicum hallii TaxID=206008 RepID=A0A2S3GLS7_9POAL|nr:hypothetical protein PAHAL_1G060600 [Panicum hallii]